MLRHKICTGIDVTSSSPGTRHHITLNRRTNLSKEPATSISNAGHSTLMMEAADSSETSVYCHYTTEHHIPED
jgi:hypothetical protein